MNLPDLCQAMTTAQAALNEFTEDRDTRHRVLKVLQLAEDNGVILTAETLAVELADLEVAEEASTETET